MQHSVRSSYTGACYETTTGNLDLHARQYNTATGRFNRLDPATSDRTTPHISTYAYVDNTPTLYADPSGLTPNGPDDQHVDSLGEVLTGSVAPSPPQNRPRPGRTHLTRYHAPTRY
ncbi:RHS repeat-associated core domain-containing protein [Streptomyces sp. NPDC054775]